MTIRISFFLIVLLICYCNFNSLHFRPRRVLLCKLFGGGGGVGGRGMVLVSGG